MKNEISAAQRRKFLKQSMTLVFAAAAVPSFGGNWTGGNKAYNDFEKKPPLPGEMVAEFVRVAHFDLAKVKEMVEKEPMVVNACWDWGGGDFETALGAASHVGNRDIASYLMEHGARKDIYCSAMLGERDLVQTFIKTNPGIANVDGPHTFSLLYHVAISGDTKMAALVKPHIADHAADFNQALHAAVRNGHTSMTEWMLKNGCSDPNTKDFVGNTPLQNAEKKNYKEIIALLRKHDAK
jgi:hypothetical protein